MSSFNWKSKYGKGRHNRPGFDEIIAFLPENVGGLFQEFSRHLSREYDVGCKPPTYSETVGWVYSFGRYNINLVNRVSIEDDAFAVNGMRVCDQDGYEKAIKTVDSLYADYKERFYKAVAVKKEKQQANTKRRLEREKKELEELLTRINKDKFNRFRWSAKLSRHVLKKLYEDDARGIRNEELVDDVGFTLYARCLQGRDERLLMESNRLKCHNCREILAVVKKDALIECSCGHQYLFRDYMRSFRTNNMPSGAATKIFNAFIENWERAKGYSKKMILIDSLIHEFHINLNSGVKGRFVGINLIEGTKRQIEDFILKLAYGDNTERFKSNLQKK